MPVAVAMLAAVIEKKVPTIAEMTALAVLSVGVMIAVWEGSVTGSMTGVLLAVAGLFSNAAMISTTGKVRPSLGLPRQPACAACLRRSQAYALSHHAPVHAPQQLQCAVTMPAAIISQHMVSSYISLLLLP